MPGPRLLLLRRPTVPDAFASAFEAAGFDARCVPVLDFDPVNEAHLADHLAEPGRFGGLILTSPRAADALSGYDLGGWHGKPTFAVGPATAVRTRHLGLRTEGEQAGSAAALADAIIAKPPAAPLLFICGDRRRDVLPDRLRAAGISFEACVVYRTTGDASVLRRALEDRPEWLVFFSPSGVEAALECDGLSWNSVALAAIGPTTARALRAAGYPPAAVAAAPTPEALVTAVTHAHRSLDV